MESRLKQMILTASLLLLLGCQQSPVYYHKHPARQVVVLDGKEISVLTLGEDRWEAFGRAGWGDSEGAELRQRQVRAIELVTGCRVMTDSMETAGKPGMLTAKVQCPSR